jgi:hypothetical protein
MKMISYSISAGQHFDGKSVCIWRTEGNQSMKIARFQSKEAALIFAQELEWPLSDELRATLGDDDE